MPTSAAGTDLLASVRLPAYVLLCVQAVSPEFGTAGDKELLTLDFLPPQERASGPVSMLRMQPVTLRCRMASPRCIAALTLL